MSASTPTHPNGSSSGMYKESEEDRLRRQTAILEGRVLKLTHENSHLKQEVGQLNRSMEDLTRQFSQITLDNRMAYQNAQEISTRHAKETSDFMAQVHNANQRIHHLTSEVNRYQHQVQVLQSSQHTASAAESSVYVFDKSAQTDLESAPAASSGGGSGSVGGGGSKAQEERIKDLVRGESALRRQLAQREKDVEEERSARQTSERCLAEARQEIERLKVKPTVSAQSTDCKDLPQAVPLEDRQVFTALTSLGSCHPIQIKLVKNDDAMRRAQENYSQAVFEHCDDVCNLLPTGNANADGTSAAAPFTFANNLADPKWDEVGSDKVVDMISYAVSHGASHNTRHNVRHNSGSHLGSESAGSAPYHSGEGNHAHNNGGQYHHTKGSGGGPYRSSGVQKPQHSNHPSAWKSK